MEVDARWGAQSTIGGIGNICQWQQTFGNLSSVRV
jgi:hypothetical protein